MLSQRKIDKLYINFIYKIVIIDESNLKGLVKSFNSFAILDKRENGEKIRDLGETRKILHHWT